MVGPPNIIITMLTLYLWLWKFSILPIECKLCLSTLHGVANSRICQVNTIPLALQNFTCHSHQ